MRDWRCRGKWPSATKALSRTKRVRLPDRRSSRRRPGRRRGSPWRRRQYRGAARGRRRAGGVCISGAAYEHVRGRIEAEFIDLGREGAQKYRAAGACLCQSRVDAGRSRARLTAPLERRARLACPSSCCLSPISAATRAGLFRRWRDGEPDHRSLADLEAHSSSRATRPSPIKARPLDVTRVGRELDVRYVLEGSVQRSGNRMRVNVQLIEAGERQLISGPSASKAGRRSLRDAGRDRRAHRQHAQRAD